MSLVGTRPPTVDEWDKYELHHRARLATKPGLEWIKTISLLNICIRETPPAWTIPKARGTGQLTSMGRRPAGRNKDKN